MPFASFSLPVLLGLIATGIFAGSTSGMFGIGGGIFVVPAMVWIFGFSQKTATGTSLMMLLPPIGLMAFLQYQKAGEVNVAAALLLIIGFLVGSWLGAGHALSLPDMLHKKLFGALLIVMGVIYILTAK